VDFEQADAAAAAPHSAVTVTEVQEGSKWHWTGMQLTDDSCYSINLSVPAHAPPEHGYKMVWSSPLPWRQWMG
jgi:hypothetical protein